MSTIAIDTTTQALRTDRHSTQLTQTSKPDKDTRGAHVNLIMCVFRPRGPHAPIRLIRDLIARVAPLRRAIVTYTYSDGNFHIFRTAHLQPIPIDNIPVATIVI